MSRAAERLASRQLGVTHRRPNPPREPLFAPAGRLLSWKPPTARNERPVTHYRVRLGTDANEPDYELSAGQRAIAIPAGTTVVYLSAYNEVLDAESELIPVNLSAVSPAVPELALFLAGQSNAAGVFTPNMYWDTLRSRMIADWAAIAPASLNNWSGVQVWIKSPATGGGFDYKAATRPVPLKDFTTLGADRFYKGTMSMEADSIPDPVESWVFIAASLDAEATLSVDGNGNPTGKTVTLSTLAKNDDVIGFDATVAYEKSEGGQEAFRVTSTWTNPTVPRFKGVKIVMTGLGSGEVLLDTVQEGFTSSKSNAIPVPDVATQITIYAQTIYGDNTVKLPLASCPKKTLTVQKQVGYTGQEYAPLVTGFGVNTSWGTNGQGQKVFLIDASWTKPSSVLYGGARIKMIRSGVHYELSGIETGASHRYELSHFPATTENVTVYALSVDTNNRTNTYVNGVTPAASIQLTSPSLGTAGTEYTAVVTGFSVAVTYPANADGTYRARVEATFTPPSDPTWGGLDLVTYDASVYATRARVRSSPAIWTMPVPTSAQAWTVYGVSFDVNGRRNNIQTGITPSQDVIVGNAAGKLVLSRADADSFENLHFVIASNKFRILQIDGDLIVSGTVSTDRLRGNELLIGGGAGGRVGRISVYNLIGTEIGFIGVDNSKAGRVNTAGTTVNWVSGDTFVSGMVGATIYINGVAYTVFSYVSATQITLTTTAGTQANVTYSCVWGLEGGWFKTLRIGGASKTTPKFTADVSGDITMEGTLTLNLNGVTAQITNFAGEGSGYAGLDVRLNHAAQADYSFCQVQAGVVFVNRYIWMPGVSQYTFGGVQLQADPTTGAGDILILRSTSTGPQYVGLHAYTNASGSYLTLSVSSALQDRIKLICEATPYIDVVGGLVKISGTTVIDASRNIFGGTIKGTGFTATVASVDYPGVTIANTRGYSLTPASGTALLSLNKTYVTIYYKDWSGVNQQVTVVQEVTGSGSSFLTGVTLNTATDNYKLGLLT